ncbi:MAG: flagellar motor protein MotB [Planctomycetota bacterium]
MPEDLGGVGHGQDVVVIKRVRVLSHGHHGGGWKVAYADMVTALMALFIVLWILGQSEEVVRGVAGYFRDPVGFTDGGAVSIVEGGAGPVSPAAVDLPALDTAREALEARWREKAQAIREALEALPIFKRYEGQIEIERTVEGLRITLLETDDGPLFEVGGTRIGRDGNDLLMAIGREISDVDNHIAIEGHTDSRPFSPGSAMTNWELSTGRANVARRVLERAGVDSPRIFEVRGLADRRLYDPAHPQNSRNRRIAVTLLDDDEYAARMRQMSTAARSRS